MQGIKLKHSYYQNIDTINLSKNILGKKLVTNINNQVTSGIIVETEAYLGIHDKACHTFNNKSTNRTKVMYGESGFAYVYLCYGIHSLFNIVSNDIGKPEAVLIRAIEPFDGISLMLKRRNLKKKSYNLTNGPGKLSQALGINNTFNGLSLFNNNIWVEDINNNILSDNIICGKRVGVNFAGEDAKLPYRFYIKNNNWVS